METMLRLMDEQRARREEHRKATEKSLTADLRRAYYAGNQRLEAEIAAKLAKL